MSGEYDAVIVGARVAGSVLAIELARKGLQVAVLDRARFPSDTMSTHVIYPNTLARLDELGVLEQIERHEPPPLHTGWFGPSGEFESGHTPVAGRDHAYCVRRITLDGILVEAARNQGADVREGARVHGSLGTGTPEDAVRGVRAAVGGRQIEFRAPIVIGADGRHSTVAGLVGAQPEHPIATETMMLYAYWRDLPTQPRQDFFYDVPWIGTHFPADDGFHVVVLIGPASEYPRTNRDVFYRDRLAAIPGLKARLVHRHPASRVIGTRRLDGYYRRATGPGWVLLGDAGHFKHPAAVQGICDAVESASALAPMILAGVAEREFPDWRERSTLEMYAFSRFCGAVPGDAVVNGLIETAATDPQFARDLVDIWSRAQRPWGVIPRLPLFAAAAGATPADALAAAGLEDNWRKLTRESSGFAENPAAIISGPGGGVQDSAVEARAL